MRLSKSDFLDYLHCDKSLWLKKRKPEVVSAPPLSEHGQAIVADGYAVEAQFKGLIAQRSDARGFDFQRVFTTESGLFARCDGVFTHPDGSLDLYEVKSSSSVKQAHIKDAAFQKHAAEIAGHTVRRVFLVHVNRAYLRRGSIDPAQLLVFVDITEEVAEEEERLASEIEEALAFLAQDTIDEAGCDCLLRSQNSRCASFDYFNPDIPSPSIYDLPWLGTRKMKELVAERRFALDQIDPAKVNARAALALQSARSGGAVLDQPQLNRFFQRAEYPLYFLDYEAFGSAIPFMDAVAPHQQIPFQFSLHIKQVPEDDVLDHVEYLADAAELPLAMVEALEQAIGPKGNLVVWHAQYEKGKNTQMADRYPAKAAFLQDLSDRMIDLETIFKTAFVDVRFQGSSSIKKVLPVIAPDLTYAGLGISDGTAAMAGWKRMLALPVGPERDELRQDLLEYCKLDSYAMVRIFEEVERKIARGVAGS